MQSFSFPFIEEDPEITIRRNGTMAAWVAPFGADDLVDIERNIVTELFNRRMPKGKKRWGFKEIRYGRASGVPERMFTLFPKAKCIHVVRDPKKSIISSICAWNSDVLTRLHGHDDFDQSVGNLVLSYLDRWIDTTSYLQDICDDRPDSTFTVQIENVAEKMPAILDFLEARLEGAIEEHPSMLNITRTDRNIVSAIDDIYEAQVEARPALRATAARVGYAMTKI